MKKNIFIIILNLIILTSCTSSLTKEADKFRLQGEFEQAAELYRRAADKGDGYACFRLGDCYKNGLGVNKDESESFSLYQKGAKKKCIQAQIEEARCYLYGIGVNVNEKKGVEMIENISQKSKHEYAKAALASLYLYGNDIVNQDAERALSILQTCKTNSWAFYLLGCLYYFDDGYKIDYPKAIEYFEKAGKLGYGDAYDKIGYMYYVGYGVEQDRYVAFEYFEKAAKLGSSNGSLNLGICYLNGEGTTFADEPEAIRWFMKATEYGSAEAAWRLYLLFKDRNEGKADYYLWEAGKLKYIAAYNDIGYNYFHGIRMEQNYSKAFYYFKLAADSGNKMGCKNVAICYEYGYGCEISPVMAQKYRAKVKD